MESDCLKFEKRFFVYLEFEKRYVVSSFFFFWKWYIILLCCVHLLPKSTWMNLQEANEKGWWFLTLSLEYTFFISTKLMHNLPRHVYISWNYLFERIFYMNYTYSFLLNHLSLNERLRRDRTSIVYFVQCSALSAHLSHTDEKNRVPEQVPI